MAQLERREATHLFAQVDRPFCMPMRGGGGGGSGYASCFAALMVTKHSQNSARGGVMSQQLIRAARGA